MKRWLAPTIAFPSILLATIGSARAGDCSVGDAAELQACLAQLGPGDTLVLEPGEFLVDNITLEGLTGQSDAPIIIRGTLGPNGERLSHIIGQSSGSNVIDIVGSSYLGILDFELSFVGGPTNNSIDLIKFGGLDAASHHITLDNLDLHDCGNVAISSQAIEIHDIVVSNSHVHDIGGSCFYWGYYEDENPLRWAHHSEIENNLLQRCPADASSDTHYGIQLKSGNHDNRIADNVLVDVGGTTRAGIIVYHSAPKPVGSPLAGSNVIERNLIVRSRNEGINAAAGAIIANNIVVDAQGIAIFLQPRSYGGATYYGSLVVAHNTVVQTVGGVAAHGIRWTADPWSLDDPGRPSAFIGNLALIANGAEGLRPPPGAITIDSNATDGNANGTPDTLMLDDPAAALHSLVFGEPGYLVPSEGGALVDPRIAAIVLDDYALAERDASPDIGAYEWIGVLPPVLDEDAFKPDPQAGDGDGDTSEDGDSGSTDEGDTSDEGEGTSEGEGGSESESDEGGTGSDANDDEVGEGPASAGEDGCGCTSTGAEISPLWLLTLLALRRRERARA